MTKTFFLGAVLLNLLYAGVALFLLRDVLLVAPEMIAPPQALSITAALATIYFIPWVIALGRAHHNTKAVFALNLFLGWTALGWVGALVWSLTAVRPSRETPISADL